MKEKDIHKLLELINEFVDNDNAPYAEKRDAILALADEGDRRCLEEFASWFAPE